MPHFIINSFNTTSDFVIVSEKNLFNHLTKSLRIKPKEKILFIDENSVQYETLTEEISQITAKFRIVKKYKSERILPLNITLAQSVLKSDAQNGIIQKATELGVKSIIPLYTDNCSVKRSFIETKIEKWQKIAKESVQQCERADIPTVCKLSEINDNLINRFDNIFVFAERRSKMTFSQYIRKHKIDKQKNILVIIGCEGGFSNKELDFFESKNIPLLTLGKLILRAETACTTGLFAVINGILYEN